MSDNKSFKVGDKVKVEDAGKSYTIFTNMAETLNLNNYHFNALPKNGGEYHVVSQVGNERDTYIGIEDRNGLQYIMLPRGLSLVEDGLTQEDLDNTVINSNAMLEKVGESVVNTNNQHKELLRGISVAFEAILATTDEDFVMVKTSYIEKLSEAIDKTLNGSNTI